MPVCQNLSQRLLPEPALYHPSHLEPHDSTLSSSVARDGGVNFDCLTLANVPGMKPLLLGSNGDLTGGARCLTPVWVVPSSTIALRCLPVLGRDKICSAFLPHMKSSSPNSLSS